MARTPKPVVFDEPGTEDGNEAFPVTDPTELPADVQAQLAELAALKAAQLAGPQVIRVQKAGDFVPEPPKPAPVFHVAAKRIRIILEDNEAIPPTGLFISPNGKPYLLMPSVEADVPLEVINVLNDAVSEVAVIDPQTQRVIGYRKRLRFPYQVVHRPAA